MDLRLSCRDGHRVQSQRALFLQPSLRPHLILLPASLGTRGAVPEGKSLASPQTSRCRLEQPRTGPSLPLGQPHGSRTLSSYLLPVSLATTSPSSPPLLQNSSSASPRSSSGRAEKGRLKRSRSASSRRATGSGTPSATWGTRVLRGSSTTLSTRKLRSTSSYVVLTHRLDSAPDAPNHLRSRPTA